MKNRTLRNINIEKFGYICMAGYSLSKNNILTVHHIIEVSNGGRSTIENSSNISVLAHSGIHILSQDDYRKRQQIINYLKQYKNCPQEQMRLDFADWLQYNVTEMGFKQLLTKDKLLVYTKEGKK